MITYIVDIQNPSSRTFTVVTFQSKQAISTENEIQLADDTVEETKDFCLELLLGSLDKKQLFSETVH